MLRNPTYMEGKKHTSDLWKSVAKVTTASGGVTTDIKNYASDLGIVVAYGVDRHFSRISGVGIGSRLCETEKASYLP